MGASINKALVVVAFNLNQDMIATELCENRNQPQKHCNGHCYLKKEITKEDTANKKNLPYPISQLFQDFVWVSPFEVLPAKPVFFGSDRQTYAAFQNPIYTGLTLSDIAHPPCGLLIL
jgi:hypothetical protein